MTSTHHFVEQLEAHVHERLAGLDLIKEPEIGAVDRSEVVRRLKMALKNELEASEIAAVWIPTTPEIEVKLALARQVGDEAKHYKLIEFCEAAGDLATAKLYRESIQPDEEWHVRLGRTVLEKYATTPELQARARSAVEAVLDLAVKVQNKQLKEMKVSHAPGC